jgi:hypothetical protein
MSHLNDDAQTHELLMQALSAEPPKPDFSQWRQRHPESAELLAARAQTDRETTPPTALSRMGAWIVDHKRRALSCSAATAAAAVVVCVCWLYHARDPAHTGAKRPGTPKTAETSETAAAQAPPAPAELLPGGQASVASADQDDARRDVEPSPSRVRAEAIAATAAPVKRKDGTTAGLASHADKMPLTMQLAGATLLMRGKMVAFTNEKFVFAATRVLYGRLEGETVEVYPYPSRKFRDYDRIHYGFDQEILLGLAEFRRRDGVWHYRAGYSFRGSHIRPLDDEEETLRKIVADGTFLVPASLESSHAQTYIRLSDRIVRAELREIGAATAEWRVEETLSPLSPAAGEPGPPAKRAPPEKTPREAPPPPRPATISVGLDPWRLRAEAIVRGREARPLGAQLDEAAVRREFDRLLKAELPAGQKAVLFVREPNGKYPDLFRRHEYHDLVGILKGDVAKPLDEVARAIRRLVEAGDRGKEW